MSNNQSDDNRDKEDNKMKGVDKVRQTDSRAVCHNASTTLSTGNAFTFRSIERNEINSEEYRYALISKNIICECSLHFVTILCLIFIILYFSFPVVF